MNKQASRNDLRLGYAHTKKTAPREAVFYIELKK